MTYIYALCDPVTGDVRYIGKANNPAARLKSHMRDARRRNTPVYCWIRKLGVAPAMMIIEECDDWAAAERRHIALHSQGGLLLNLAAGGDEPSCPAETRANNGRKVAAMVHGNPYKRRVWELKRGMLDTLRFFKRRGDLAVVAKIEGKMKELAARRPDICGDWA